jgi:hypothetical protein
MQLARRRRPPVAPPPSSTDMSVSGSQDAGSSGGAPATGTLSGVDPASAPLGATLTVSGAGFQSGDTVKLTTAGQAFALATVSLASSTIIATLPGSGPSPGAGTVSVERSGSSLGSAPFNVTSGKVYYIAPNGNDSAAGTQAAPWARIENAASKMKPGDLAYLRGGTYNGSMAPTASGAQGAPLTFAGYPGETALLTATLAIKGTYLTFDHLHVTNGVEFAIGVDVEVSAHDITLSNCEVYGTKGQGIIVTGQHNTFLRNAVHDNGMHANQDHGIYVQGAYNTFKYNRVYNNWDYGMHLYSGLSGTPAGNNVIDSNFIYHNGYGAHSTGNNYTAGIIVSSQHANVTVKNNVICDNADYGVFTDSEPNRQISGNVSCFNHSGGFLIAQSGASTALNGNISYMDGGSSLMAYSGNSTTSDNNTYWHGTTAPSLQWNDSSYALAGFRTASGLDAHSSLADPHFTSVPSGSFDSAKMGTYNFCTTLNPALCGPF